MGAIPCMGNSAFKVIRWVLLHEIQLNAICLHLVGILLYEVHSFKMPYYILLSLN